MKLQANFTSTAVKQVSQQMTEEKMSEGKKKVRAELKHPL